MINEIKNEIDSKRPPVVVIMGHVDHGKSTLLDYIRDTNIVSSEAGGITQNISAYEVTHKNEKGEPELITFLDTPGHEAFSKMRERGAHAADIAILIVSAEDSVKAQTIEAYNTIVESKTPYIVAINKIDRPNANIEKTKMDLVEKGIYLEGMGGDIPFVLISAKEGTGVNELLDMIVLMSEIYNFKGQKSKKASGIIIEANCDPKRGITATCIIKNGTLKSGMFVATDNSIVTTRIMEDFLGKNIKEATFSSPIRLVGFETMPEVGNIFESFNTKKEAEEYVKIIQEENKNQKNNILNENKTEKIIPIIIKTDVAGTIEAIEKEILKINKNDISFRILNSNVGAINESDIRMASVDKNTVILGFNINIDNRARDLNESLKVNIQIFNIIYKMTDWLKELIEDQRPKTEQKEVTGSIKILKTFGSTKERKVLGGKVLNGKITQGGIVRIMRRDFEIGTGKIVELQTNKVKTKEIQEGYDCGILVETRTEIAPGDVLESFIISYI
jgi:translation initiation factor IF-2